MGLSPERIAEITGAAPATLRSYIAQLGGIAPQRWVDPDRFLSIEERHQIKELLVQGCSLREIGRQLGRSPSTISREVKRGGNAQGWRSRYRPSAGHRKAWENRRRPKALKIVSSPRLFAAVQAGLDQRFSPEQIVGRLKREHPDDRDMHVSHETIYKTIYLQARGGLKRELQAVTRTGRTLRKSQRSAVERRGRITGMVSVWDRPVEALDRRIPGHWEGDLIIGKDGASAIGTVVERHSNYVILVHLDPEKNRICATRDGLVKKLSGLPDVLKGSLTWDQGKEMSDHAKTAAMTGIDIYFADPHSPWQRATNENTNGLLRQYFPKGTDLSIHSEQDLDYVADQMNRRPRKRLDYATPYEVLSEHLLQ